MGRLCELFFAAKLQQFLSSEPISAFGAINPEKTSLFINLKKPLKLEGMLVISQINP